MSGIASCFLSLRRSTGVYSVAMWRAVVTVDWITKMSAPASWAICANRSARCGIEETTAGPPPFLIAWIRWWINSSLIGPPYIDWMILKGADQGGVDPPADPGDQEG